MKMKEVDEIMVIQEVVRGRNVIVKIELGM